MPACRALPPRVKHATLYGSTSPAGAIHVWVTLAEDCQGPVPPWLELQAMFLGINGFGTFRVSVVGKTIVETQLHAPLWADLCILESLLPQRTRQLSE